MENRDKEFKAVLKTLKNNKVMVDTREDGIYIRLAGNSMNGEILSYLWAKVYQFQSEVTEPPHEIKYINNYDDEDPNYIRQSQEEI